MKLAEILATLLEIFARSTKVIKGSVRGRFVHYTKDVLHGRDEKLQELAKKVHRLTESETRLVGAETFTETRSTGQKADGVADLVNETNKVVHEGRLVIDEVGRGVDQMTISQDASVEKYAKRSVM